MKLTIYEQLKEKMINLEIDDNETVSTLQELISIEMGMQVDQQQLSFNQKILQGNQIIKECGLKDNDMIILTQKMNFFGGQQQQNNNGQNNLMQQLQNVMNNIGNNNNNGNQQGNNNNNNWMQNMMNPMNNQRLVQEAQRQKDIINSNPDQLNFLFHQDRELAEAAVSDNIEDMVKVIQKRQQKAMQEKMQREQRLLQLQMDPMNPDNQKEIEKIIQEQNIEQQRELAMEEHPEFFGRISMLYIEIGINGNPIQAFVDSGAESTIMSRVCAERCGLMRFIDRRYAGMALGVGKAQILGRIHLAQMEILDKKLPVNLTILDDDKIEFLLGLDTLKRYQCIMNLGERNLSFMLEGQKLTVPFLSDGQIKKTVSIAAEQAMAEEAEKKGKMQEEKQPNNGNTQQQNNGNNNNGGFKEDDIKMLMDIGATRQEAINALRQCGGKVDLAAGVISANKFGF